MALARSDVKIADQIITIDDVRYVPDLSESIYSLFRHIQTPSHSVYSSFEDGLFINFPNLQYKALLGEHDIYIDMVPMSEQAPTASNNDVDSNTVHTDSFCRNLKQFTDDVTRETKYLDNVLKSLRRYYKAVKTRRQLGMEAPAGFRTDNQWCRQLREFNTTQDLPISDLSQLSSVDSPTSLEILNQENTLKSSIDTPDLDSIPITNDSSLAHIPILQCVDKPSSSLPSRVMLTEDIIRASVGFRRVDTIKKHLSTLYQDTIILDKLPPDAILDMGDIATIHKANRNTTPVPRPSNFADVIHMDIVFGPDISVGNIHYGLLFTDRYSRMTYIYPLKTSALILFHNWRHFLRI